MTTNTNLQLIQYKTIHRTHFSQSKLFKIGQADTAFALTARQGALIICMPVGPASRSISYGHQLQNIFYHFTLQNPTLPLTLPSWRHHFHSHSTEMEISTLCLSTYCQENSLSKLEIQRLWSHKLLDQPNFKTHPNRRTLSSKEELLAFKDIWNPFIFLTNSAIIVPFTLPTRA